MYLGHKYCFYRNQTSPTLKKVAGKTVNEQEDIRERGNQKRERGRQQEIGIILVLLEVTKIN